MPTATFFYRFCPNGHGVYAQASPPEDTHCGQCGEKLLETCNHCGASMTFAVTCLYKASDGQPYSHPKRPSFCKKCGSKYQWVERLHKKIEETGIWMLFHPKVVKLAKGRYESGHYADAVEAVEAVFKELNSRIKRLWLKRGGQETDGPDLMRKVLKPEGGLIRLGDINTETGRRIQQGYMEIFAGSMSSFRNPNAHANLDISPEQAVHHLMLGSLLFNVLDEGSVLPNEISGNSTD